MKITCPNYLDLLNYLFKLLGLQDLRKKIDIYSYSIDIALLKNRTGEITSSIYLTSIDDIEGNFSNLNNGALLIIIWERNCFFPV